MTLVTLVVMARHRGKGSTDGPDRAEIASEVLGLLDEACLKIGGLLASAVDGPVEEWAAWVEESTPFTFEEARRLRGVYLAYTLFSAEMAEGLPRPFAALWTIPAGRIGRGMPRSAHRSRRATNAELLATALMERGAETLGDEIIAALMSWLHSRDVLPEIPPSNA
jgi:hypothetical protein